MKFHTPVNVVWLGIDSACLVFDKLIIGLHSWCVIEVCILSSGVVHTGFISHDMYPIKVMNLTDTDVVSPNIACVCITA